MSNEGEKREATEKMKKCKRVAVSEAGAEDREDLKFPDRIRKHLEIEENEGMSKESSDKPAKWKNG